VRRRDGGGRTLATRFVVLAEPADRPRKAVPGRRAGDRETALWCRRLAVHGGEDEARALADSLVVKKLLEDGIIVGRQPQQLSSM